MRESDIIFERGDYWVRRTPAKSGYEVFKTGVTHSVRVGVIGYSGDEGLRRAKAEIERRITKDSNQCP